MEYRVMVLITLLAAIQLSPASVGAITINPSTVGGPKRSFSADALAINYASIVNQSLNASSSTGIPQFPFTENGGGAITSFLTAEGNAVKGTGLNGSYVLSATFSADGYAVPTGPPDPSTGLPPGFTATFTGFDLKMYANGMALIGQSTGLIPLPFPHNTATILLDSATHATGTFNVTFGFSPVGGFFGGGIQSATLGGMNNSFTIFGGTDSITSIHTGTGALSFTTSEGVSQSLPLGTESDSQSFGTGRVVANPEPSTVLLVGAGLAGFAALRFRRFALKKSGRRVGM